MNTNTNVNVDISASLITYQVACAMWSQTIPPDLTDEKVRAEFFAMWAKAQADMAAVIRRERVNRDAKKAASRKAHQELVGNLERRLTALYKALTDYPKTDERHSQAKVVCDGVRKLAQQIINEGKPQ